MDNEFAPVESVEISTPEVAVEVDNSSTQEVAQDTTSETAISEAPPVEKMIPQSQVNRIAAREAREAEARVRAQYERQAQEAQLAIQAAQQNGGVAPQFSVDQVRNIILQEQQALVQRQHIESIVTDWNGAMDAERAVDPDFDRLYEDLNIEAHPLLVVEMSKMDNKAAMVKEMAKNPVKFSNILVLANSQSPALARKELQKLSASIKANTEAQKVKPAAEPLSQLKSSNIGTSGGDSNKSVSEFRKMFQR